MKENYPQQQQINKKFLKNNSKQLKRMHKLLNKSQKQKRKK